MAKREKITENNNSLEQRKTTYCLPGDICFKIEDLRGKIGSSNTMVLVRSIELAHRIFCPISEEDKVLLKSLIPNLNEPSQPKEEVKEKKKGKKKKKIVEVEPEDQKPDEIIENEIDQDIENELTKKKEQMNSDIDNLLGNL